MNGALDLRIEKILDAPRDQLFNAWSDGELIKRWWAPRPYETTDCEIELHPGGRFYTRMTGPDGFEYAGSGCVLEVAPNDRIVWTTALQGGFRPNDFATSNGSFPFVAIHTFEDVGGNRTCYSATVLHATADDAQKHAAMGFEIGWGIVADQMAEVANSLR